MDAKLDCEVDVEGPADMMVREEEGASISRRPCLRPNTAHEPRGNRAVNALACGHFHVAYTRSSSNQSVLLVFF
jgi:hypothetical protein